MARSDGDGSSRTTPLQALGLGALGLGIFVLGVVLLEAVLALGGLGDRERHADPWVGFAPGSDLFVREERGGVARWVTAPAKLGFFNEQSFAVAKPEGSLRVFALGGSTTAGRPYDASVSFPAWLERWIRLADPSRRAEVVNAGAISYASYRVALLQKELLRFEPDVFLLYTGHNEFLEERTYGELRDHPEALRRLGAWLGGFRSWSLLRARLAHRPQQVLPSEVTARLDDPRGLDSYRRDVNLQSAIVRHYEDNLRRIVRVARDADVLLIAVRPASNIADFSPFKSDVAEDLPRADRVRALDLLAAAERQLTDGRPAEVLALLDEALEIDPEVPDLWFLRGRALLAAGRVDPAREAFVRARDLDIAPLRAPSAILEAYDRVVGDLGVETIDLPGRIEDELRSTNRPPIPGDPHFLDHVHPRIEVHADLAAEMLDRLAASGLVETGSEWTEAHRREVVERVVAELDPRYLARRDLNLSKVLGWAGKLAEAEAPLRRAAAVLDDEPDVHLNLGILDLRAGRLAEARASLERARELAPDQAGVHFNLGVVLGGLGEPDAGAAALRRALELDADAPEIWVNLAFLELARGRSDAARQAAERALELRPDDADALRALARVEVASGRLEDALAVLGGATSDPAAVLEKAEILVGLGRPDEAEAALGDLLERRLHAEAAFRLGVLRSRRGDLEGAAEAYELAARVDPRHARSLTNLGILAARAGRAPEAAGLFRRVVEVRPDGAEGWLNLGVALDQAGRPEEAVEALRRAVELDPTDPRARQALALLLEGRGRE